MSGKDNKEKRRLKRRINTVKKILENAGDNVKRMEGPFHLLSIDELGIKLIVVIERELSEIEKERLKDYKVPSVQAIKKAARFFPGANKPIWEDL